MLNVLVTGSNGQLGSEVKELSSEYEYNFFFTDRDNLDISNQETIKNFVQTNDINIIINCAAYTAVDKAENDVQKAFEINADGARNLAQTCDKNNTVLIHISTDFVFNGEASKPYKETDQTNPISVYGKSKLKGEEEIIQIFEKYFIIRTSWLYSEYGNNFMKTMIRLSKQRNELSIVSDQIGTPTYAKDLAEVILDIINTNAKQYGTYHYSNEGVLSWYDFAKTIFEITNINITLNPIQTDAYPTLAKRPHFSVLDKTKIKLTLDIKIPHWKDSLKKAILNL